MMEANVYTKRYKVRKLFEQRFKSLNDLIVKKAENIGVEPFFIKYSDHLFDRIVQREIDEEYMFSLFEKMTEKMTEINSYLNMSEVGETPRPHRLEVTDGNLWLGFTVDLKHPNKMYSIKSRMAVINNKRLVGKIPTKVIHV